MFIPTLSNPGPELVQGISVVDLAGSFSHSLWTDRRAVVCNVSKTLEFRAWSSESPVDYIHPPLPPLRLENLPRHGRGLNFSAEFRGALGCNRLLNQESQNPYINCLCTRQSENITYNVATNIVPT